MTEATTERLWLDQLRTQKAAIKELRLQRDNLQERLDKLHKQHQRACKLIYRLSHDSANLLQEIGYDPERTDR